jgi:hypothetical protein
MVLATPGPLPTPPPSSSPPKLVSSCSCVRACIYLIFIYQIYVQRISLLYRQPTARHHHHPLLRFMLLTEPCAWASTSARPPSSAPLPPRCGSDSWPSSMGSRPTPGTVCVLHRPPGTAHTQARAFVTCSTNLSLVFTCMESRLFENMCCLVCSRVCVANVLLMCC